MKTGWIIMTSTLYQGNIPGCWDENDVPVVFDTEEEAQAEIEDAYITRKETWKEDGLEGEPDPEEEWTEEITILEDGRMVNNFGDIIFNPDKQEI